MEKFFIDIAKKIWPYVVVFGALFFFVKQIEINNVKKNDYSLFVKYKSGEEVDESLFLDKKGIYFALYKSVEMIKKLNNNVLLSKDDLIFLHRDINRFPIVKYVVLMSLDLNKKFDEYRINDGDMKLQYSPWPRFIDSYSDMRGILTGSLSKNIEDDFESSDTNKENIEDSEGLDSKLDSEGLDSKLDIADEIYD
jgi:hypothetical protein